jgi:hypothetical protein
MQKQNNKIDIITYFNHHHKILYDLYFKPTFDLFLTDNFNLITKYADNAVSDNIQDYGYTNKIWQQMIVDRFDIIINHIQNNINPDTASIFSDVDVIFFDNFYLDLQPFLKNKSLLLWYMPESINANPYTKSYYINGGFFCFKHSEKILEYFFTIQKLLIEFDGIKNDQTIIQSFLKNNNIKYINIMPFSVFNTNNCDINNNTYAIKNKTLKVFHATGASSVNEKIIILERIIRT